MVMGFWRNVTKVKWPSMRSYHIMGICYQYDIIADVNLYQVAMVVFARVLHREVTPPLPAFYTLLFRIKSESTAHPQGVRDYTPHSRWVSNHVNYLEFFFMREMSLFSNLFTYQSFTYLYWDSNLNHWWPRDIFTFL